MESRGLRNCNPGNIRITKDKWKGLRPVQEDKSFFQFVSMEYGYRALIRTLQNYRKKYRCQSVTGFIQRWAPPVENNTAAYIERVCKEMGVKSDYIPSITDKKDMCALAAAISLVENGIKANMEEVEKGWELL